MVGLRDIPIEISCLHRYWFFFFLRYILFYYDFIEENRIKHLEFVGKSSFFIFHYYKSTMHKSYVVQVNFNFYNG